MSGEKGAGLARVLDLILVGLGFLLCWSRTSDSPRGRLIGMGLLIAGSKRPRLARILGRLAATALSGSSELADQHAPRQGEPPALPKLATAAPPMLAAPADDPPARAAISKKAIRTVVGVVTAVAVLGGMTMTGLVWNAGDASDSRPGQLLAFLASGFGAHQPVTGDEVAQEAMPAPAPEPVPQAESSGASAAPPGCEYGRTFTTLVGWLGSERIGACSESERPNPVTGDVEQRPAAGLLAWSKANDVAAFTDGAATWYACQAGLQKRPSGEAFQCSGAVVFADNFDDAAAGRLPKVSVAPSSYAREYLAGEYRIQKIGTQWDRLPSVFIPGKYADAKLAVDARLVDDPGHRYVGLGCRHQGKSSSYQLYVSPAVGQYSLSRWDDGEEVILAGWQAAPAIRRGQETNHLELSCVQDVITASINGTQVASLHDATYREGLMFLFLSVPPGAELGVDARFDNLAVSQDQAQLASQQ